MKITEALSEIQSELKAPKSQKNTFGNYMYRSLEDIMESLKHVLIKRNASVTVSDEMVMIGDRFYIKATATLWIGEEQISTTAFARESLSKKGMDEAQITGSASSYARKYAMNGLFAIDDTKDSDATNTGKDDKKEVDNTEMFQTYIEDCDKFIDSKNLVAWWKKTSEICKKDLGQAGAAKVYKHMLENKKILEGEANGTANG